ncbi:S41 family peptidase [Saccharolobus caldissimus]|uniref:Tricorn protease homolog n=1 Tax=Saccharolobus caldissimus TaxID=1702097 RepID=A0AAQ4CR03_9CREN|nr:S41 family peptidase [Saccharolobus caldissimus]BDB98234.1 peptidase S41 [Saccharolobus caldissimus]
MKGYYMFPDIRGNTVAFTSDDDIWIMDLSQNKPIRLTSGIGISIRPKISLDGKRVAFTVIWLKSGKSGGDIYVTGDGESKRVTFFGTNNSRVAGWISEDEIIVITNFHTPFIQWTEAYKVNINDGNFEKLPFGIVSNIAIRDDIIVLARGYQDLPFWKGYKGGTKGELWISYNNGKTFTKFISLDGIVSWPMIVNDRVYFLSDHEGIANLYSVNLDGKDLRKHTNFTEYYCRNASSDGNRIVFQNGGDIYLYDPKSEQLIELEIDLPTDRKKRQPKFVNVTEYMTEAVVNGNYISLVSRGKIFLMRPWEGPAVQLGSKQGVRYRQIQLLPNGDVIAVDDSDKLVILGKDGSEKKIDKDFGRIERVKVSPDGKKVLISNNKLELWLYEIESNSAKLIDKSEYDIIFGMDWHPNSEWFAYSFPEGHNTQSIKLGHISGKVIRVTSPYGFDFSPSFDPDGRYLYFLSARHLDPTNDKLIFNLSFQRVVKPYLLVLSNAYSPFNQPLEEVSDKKEIELEGIEDRVIPFPVDEDNYVQIAGAKNNKIFLFSYPIRGFRSFTGEIYGKLEVYDLDSKTKELFADNVSGFSLSGDKSKILVMFKDSLRLVDVNAKIDFNAQGKKGGVVDLSRVKVYVEPEKEWRQMLWETWKLMKQNYWNEKNLPNWDSVLAKYEKLLDRISTRFELSDLLQEMQGETRTSHSYESAYDYETPEPLSTGGLGAEFEFDKENKCYKIVKIYVGDPTNENERSPLRDPGVQLNVGDCIKAVDGEEVKNNLYYYLLNKDQVILDVITRDGKNRRVTVKVLKDERFLIYRYWVERNREYVHEKSKGRLGYIHIPDMMFQGFAEFYRLFISEFDKDGLIIDVRFNRGGSISGLLLEKLMLKRMGYDIPRNGKPIPVPFFSSPKVLVGITNEYAGSDGDIFSYLFKKYKLGVLVGKRTWGGVVGILPRYRLVDKTYISQPEFAVHFEDIGLGIENHGVDPDIEIEIKPEDYAEDKDPQLDKAIELALKEISK